MHIFLLLLLHCNPGEGALTSCSSKETQLLTMGFQEFLSTISSR